MLGRGLCVVLLELLGRKRQRIYVMSCKYLLRIQRYYYYDSQYLFKLDNKTFFSLCWMLFGVRHSMYL